MELECGFCKKKFSIVHDRIEKYRPKFCSKECFYSGRKQRQKNNSVVRPCLHCGKSFDVEFSKREKRTTCSRKCRADLRSSHIDWNSFGHAISVSRREGLDSGRVVQIRGPHSEKSKRLMSVSRRANIIDGMKNGMLGRRHTEESRLEMSKTRTQRMIDGLYDKSKWFTRGKLFCKKANKDVPYRSSWELIALRRLEDDTAVVSFGYECIRIEYYQIEGDYKHLRYYVPDFLVTYVDNRKEIIEVKPKCYLNSAVNLAKFEAARNYCLMNGMTFIVWTQDDLEIETSSIP